VHDERVRGNGYVVDATKHAAGDIEFVPFNSKYVLNHHVRYVEYF